MRRRSREEETPHNLERWLLTYADLITLLMIFFVMMYAMSSLNAQKFELVAFSLSKALQGNSIVDLYNSPPQVNKVVPKENELETIKQHIAEFVKANGFGETVLVREDERGLIISLQDTLLFPKGSADITPKALGIIRKVGESLAPIPNYIRIEGHTDDLPINTQKFPSNWELSVLRATNVVHVLIRDSKISPGRLSAAGYSEYRPVTKNVDERSRALNRRVDIVILRQEYSRLEPHN